MEAVARHAEAGRLVFGSCNGFQILCESGLLPGALMRNDSLQFRCQPVHLRVENVNTPFSRACRPGQMLRIPISHGEGSYDAARRYPGPAGGDGAGRIPLHNAGRGSEPPEANPNGSLNNIAGIINERGNVLGMMPHPERASEALMGGEDGLFIWRSLLESAVGALSR